jgi:hypothetical protein
MTMQAYMKAIIAALSAGVGALITGASDGVLDLQEWLIALAATLAALGLVYAVPNRRTTRAPRTTR